MLPELAATLAIFSPGQPVADVTARPDTRAAVRHATRYWKAAPACGPVRVLVVRRMLVPVELMPPQDRPPDVTRVDIAAQVVEGCTIVLARWFAPRGRHRRRIIMHEVGHLIGHGHDLPAAVDPQRVMRPVP